MVFAMREFLLASQTTSNNIEVGGKRLVCTIILTSHAGGTWQLQAMAPDGTWIDIPNVTFRDNGIYSDLSLDPGLQYRLNGGTAGARAWVSEYA